MEPSGITGHPDHQTTSRLAAQVADRHGLVVVEWGIAEPVAQLRREFALPVSGLPLSDPAVLPIAVDRTRQCSAHPDNPLLARRLVLAGGWEWVRVRVGDLQQRLARFVAAVGPLARPDATPAER